ncbi:MAG: response regulator [Planktothrix sp.]|uniref:ATP-binding response regulator n=1 Tax=Planktothrix sp. TaxID=3088171 RepID=UPI0038D42D11
MKILIIEDEDTILQNVIDLLQAEKFEAIGAEEGQLGIHLALNYKPDLILCDIMMPDIDGYTVLTELQKQPLLAHIPFIFMTAKVEREDLRLGMELGADDYITKPFTPVELLSAIRARMKKQQQYSSQYNEERERAKALKQKIGELEQLSQTREELLVRVTEELRDPMSNISLAIQMLNLASTHAAEVPHLALKQKDYLKILQEECKRELNILNQISELQALLTADNIKLLRKLNLFEDNKNA